MDDMEEQAKTTLCLDCASWNDECEETIILIHGAGTSGHDWDLVNRNLRCFHLLCPHLFTSDSLNLVRRLGEAKKLHWQTRYVECLASLIRLHAKNGRAHIVGLSLGGCFAVALAAEHPELSISLFVSGLPRLMTPPKAFLRPLAVNGLWVCQRVIELLGPDVVSFALDGQIRPHSGGWDGKGGSTTRETQEILVDTIAGGLQIPIFDSQRFRTVQAQPGQEEFQVKIIAATRRTMFTPTGDTTDWAVDVAKHFVGLRTQIHTAADSLNAVNIEVLEAKGMFHPWNRQDPELFAQCILATIQGVQISNSSLLQVWTSK